MHVLHVVGARPNFVKAAALFGVSCAAVTRSTLVHTGQHYDRAMSDVLFQELGLPEPDVNLGVGSGTHARQTADVMTRLEPVVKETGPDLVLVYGDVNSTVAAALVCAKLLVPVGHVEAGLRSFDRTMPEEINRVLADHLADLLFTPSSDADQNLRREGVEASRVHLVGNVMIDALVRLLPHASRDRAVGCLAAAGAVNDAGRGSDPVEYKRYGLVTLHRPSNVDDTATLGAILDVLTEASRELPIVFPVHPRTRLRLEELQFAPAGPGLRLVEPLGYLDFLALQRYAEFVVTDSGGVQEESTYLGVPCLTFRENTERPVTVATGTNVVVGQDVDCLRAEIRQLLDGNRKQGEVPPLWDGRAAERIWERVVEWRARQSG